MSEANSLPPLRKSLAKHMHLRLKVISRLKPHCKPWYCCNRAMISQIKQIKRQNRRFKLSWIGPADLQAVYSGKQWVFRWCLVDGRGRQVREKRVMPKAHQTDGNKMEPFPAIRTCALRAAVGPLPLLAFTESRSLYTQPPASPTLCPKWQEKRIPLCLRQLLGIAAGSGPLFSMD
jgi:hypothetical protein